MSATTAAIHAFSCGVHFQIDFLKTTACDILIIIKYLPLLW